MTAANLHSVTEAGAGPGDVATLAGTYARMAGELAAMVDQEERRSARAAEVLSGAFAELREALAALATAAAREVAR